MTDTPADPPDLPALRTQSDLADLWLVLLAPEQHADPALWLLLVDADDRPTRVLVRIGEVPLGTGPGPEIVAELALFLEELVAWTEPAARAAMLLERPGPTALDARDRAWASGLYAACRAAGVPADVVHLAGDGGVLPVPMDELADSA